jgi:hypothetical protein
MHDDKGVPIRYAVSAKLGADVSAGAGPVVHDHGLSQDRREALSEPSCANIDYAADSSGNDDANWLVRPGAIRPSTGRRERASEDRNRQQNNCVSHRFSASRRLLRRIRQARRLFDRPSG